MVKKVIVVDDDANILRRARSILSGDGKDVVILKSGSMLFDYISKKGFPDLLLLDIRMPDTDGYEVLKKLRSMERDGEETPVIFLTGNDDDDTEIKSLSLGAMDFIRKPFVAEVLLLRVNHAIELVNLQRHLATEVRNKTIENEMLSLHVVQALADAIDAKDTYTNGHSQRVAGYAREIAKRMGCTQERQDAIYIMGLLHDVGKIGVPDSIINKTQRLNDEEFSQIKKHPGIGGGILENITEMPTLYYGARWHHERYDGTGYPDGLKADNIPLEARIISVADAYDAMVSNRSYRSMLPISKVKSEIESGKGTQFDPTIADIMLEIIDDEQSKVMPE